MQNLLVSVQVVLPLILMMLVGVGVRRLNLADEQTLRKVDNIAFRIFLPILLFQNLYAVDLSQAFNPALIGYTVACVFLIFGLSMWLIPRFEKDNKKRAAIVQTIIRSNFLIFGLAVAVSLYGEGNAASVALLGSVFVPLSNALAVFVLEYFRMGKVSFGKIALGIIKNPLVVAALLSLTVLLLGIPVPAVIRKTVKDMSSVATPLCLLTLGASLRFADAKENARQIGLGLLARMVIVPCVFLTLAALIGFRGEALLALLVLFASPTAVSSYTMAQQMGADGKLAGQLVAFTTGTSIFTIFLFVYIFKELRFL